MKKAFLISLFLTCVSLSGLAQTSIQGRETNVRAWGAKCDGSTNDQSAIQAAITAMATAGGIVNLPDGTCLVTGLSVPGGVTLRGKGKYVSTLKSSTNAAILNLVQGSGVFAFFGPKVHDLWVDGSDSGSSQIGIQITDATYMRDVAVEDVMVTDCGSHGISFGNVFSSSFKNLYSSSHGGYPFFYNSPNMPSNYFYGLYAGDISAAAPAGFRIKQGTFICWSCNGVNTNAGSTGYWAVIGGKNGDIDGDSSAFYANARFVDCNIEGAKTAGVLNYPGSVPSFEGETTFVGLLASSGSWKAIDYDTDASLFPETSQRGYISDTVIFSNSPITFYANSQPVHADGNPPVLLDGQGLRIAGHGIIGTYYNAANSRAEQLNRADGYMGVVSVTATTSFTNPGLRYLEVTCASDCAQSLPSASYYNASEIVTIKNLSATGVVVTINANSGSTVNGSSYTISTTGESVTVIPNGSSDWRIVGERFNSGASPRVPYYSSANKFTTTSGLEYDTGSTVLKSPGRFWAADTSASNPSFSFTSDIDTGFYRPSANTIGITANGANVASFGTSGLTLGVAGSVAGSLVFANSTNSNLVTITSLSTANVALSLPATSSDTLVARNTMDTLTSKTLSTGTAVSASITFSDGVKQTFNPDGTNAGINVGSQAGDPSTPANGDIWYDSTNNTLDARINGATVNLGSGSSSLTSTQVGFGSGSNLLTGSVDLTWDNTNKILAIATSGTNRFQLDAGASAFNQTFSTSATGSAHTGNAIVLSSTGTAAANFGYAQSVTLENGSGSNVAATSIAHTWSTATAGSETAEISFSTNLSGAGVGQAFAVRGGQFYGTYTTANISGAATINLNNGNSQTLTLTGNVTSTTLTGLQSGGLYFLIFKQDSSGSRTLASSNIKVSGADLTITSTANTGRTLFTCLSDGASLFCTKTLDVR